MFDKYISNWFTLIFIIWIIMEKYKIYGYQFFNVYYTSLLSALGFLILYGYYLYKGITFDATFLLFQLFTHILPIVVLIRYYKVKVKYALRTLLIVIILYILYLKYTNKNINDIYFHKDKIIKTWNNLEEKCNNNNDSFICSIYKYLHLWTFKTLN